MVRGIAIYGTPFVLALPAIAFGRNPVFELQYGHKVDHNIPNTPPKSIGLRVTPHTLPGSVN
ncbi:hypothetical protein DL95DRAFT_388476 [Leptodontidium sp. 2 PMI_412]|nr:hypothetical protein DL95DRAFT_388476 [Leptodontidium sp. 2 PMI_412]